MAPQPIKSRLYKCKGNNLLDAHVLIGYLLIAVTGLALLIHAAGVIASAQNGWLWNRGDGRVKTAVGSVVSLPKNVVVFQRELEVQPVVRFGHRLNSRLLLGINPYSRADGNSTWRNRAEIYESGLRPTGRVAIDEGSRADQVLSKRGGLSGIGELHKEPAFFGRTNRNQYLNAANVYPRSLVSFQRLLRRANVVGSYEETGNYSEEGDSGSNRSDPVEIARKARVPITVILFFGIALVILGGRLNLYWQRIRNFQRINPVLMVSWAITAIGAFVLTAALVALLISFIPLGGHTF